MELERFPRKNRYSSDWHNKYHSKFIGLQTQAEQVEETERGIKELLDQLDKQKQKALEDNFIKLSEHFDQIFKVIVPEGSTELKLVRTDANEESQKSNPTQMPDPTQMFRINHKNYRGIKVKVNFKGSEE